MEKYGDINNLLNELKQDTQTQINHILNDAEEYKNNKLNQVERDKAIKKRRIVDEANKKIEQIMILFIIKKKKSDSQ